MRGQDVEIIDSIRNTRRSICNHLEQIEGPSLQRKVANRKEKPGSDRELQVYSVPDGETEETKKRIETEATKDQGGQLSRKLEDKKEGEKVPEAGNNMTFMMKEVPDGETDDIRSLDGREDTSLKEKVLWFENKTDARDLKIYTK